jgi:RiboL-PSP-HEPN
VNGRILSNFLERVDEVDGYRKYLTSAARLADDDSSADLDGSSIPELVSLSKSVTRGMRKRFDYASIVVALYGLIEDYVEQLVENCAAEIGASEKRYQHLPDSFRANHEKLTLRLLDRVMQPSYKGRLSRQIVVSNLNSCFVDRPSFQLNTEAYALHTANVRSTTIRDMFSAASIQSIDKSVADHRLTRELIDKLGISEGEPHFYIDDLADRRNVVAHGEIPQDVLSLRTLDEYVQAARVFGQAIFDSAILGITSAIPPASELSLGAPTATYRSCRVVCFRPANHVELTVGDRLVWKTDRGWRLATIQSLEVQKKAHPTVICNSGMAVGIGLSNSGNDKTEYWLVASR